MEAQLQKELQEFFSKGLSTAFESMSWQELMQLDWFNIGSHKFFIEGL